MRTSVIPFSLAHAERVSQYCEDHSEVLPGPIAERYDDTINNRFDSDMMSSKLQGQWMVWMAEWLKPKAILEVGTYTGFSAMAWYEGTKATQAQIVSLELNADTAKSTSAFLEKKGLSDRIKIITGPAADSLKTVEGSYDLIFMDANKDAYEEYIDTILTRRLLSPNGVIFVDNVFARGLTIGDDCAPHLETMRGLWTNFAAALRLFNKKLVEDQRIDVLLLPLFDGVTQIKWKAGYLDSKDSNGTEGAGAQANGTS